MAAQIAATAPRELLRRRRARACPAASGAPPRARLRPGGADRARRSARAPGCRSPLPAPRRAARRASWAADRRARRAAATGSCCALPAPVPRHVLLVDDVHTTGATFDACARRPARRRRRARGGDRVRPYAAALTAGERTVEDAVGASTIGERSTPHDAKGAHHAHRGQGTQHPGQRRAQGARRAALRAIARQVSELAELEVELSEERNPAIAERGGRRGDAPSQGRHAARPRRVARHATRDQPAARSSSRARSSATASSAASGAPRAPRSRPRTAARRRRDGRLTRRSGRSRGGLHPALGRCYARPHVADRPCAALGGGARSSGPTSSASRASTSSSPSSELDRRQLRAAADSLRDARAARAASRSTTCSTSASRSCARPAGARWACATSTCS